jgi:hypothetical protein
LRLLLLIWVVLVLGRHSTSGRLLATGLLGLEGTVSIDRWTLRLTGWELSTLYSSKSVDMVILLKLAAHLEVIHTINMSYQRIVTSGRAL